MELKKLFSKNIPRKFCPTTEIIYFCRYCEISYTLKISTMLCKYSKLITDYEKTYIIIYRHDVCHWRYGAGEE